MPSSATRVETPNARKYMTQLCKHWSHKLEVKFDEKQGQIVFDSARACDLEAEEDALLLRIRTETDDELERTQTTLVNHLKRFAFREDFGDVAWTRQS